MAWARSTTPPRRVIERNHIERVCSDHPFVHHRCMETSNALAGRSVLITGAARRIGAALARGFHTEGANVCIHFHRSAREAEQLRDELNRARADSAIAVAADLLDLEAIPTL